MRYLDQALEAYGKSDVYPFHMPGHKRNPLPFPEVYGIDITEIDGFDNLHHAEGILKDAMETAAAIYGADRCWYLVNGSTCGILSAVFATTENGGKILTARNCHKAGPWFEGKMPLFCFCGKFDETFRKKAVCARNVHLREA